MKYIKYLILTAFIIACTCSPCRALNHKAVDNEKVQQAIDKMQRYVNLNRVNQDGKSNVGGIDKPIASEMQAWIDDLLDTLAIEAKALINGAKNELTE